MKRSILLIVTTLGVGTVALQGQSSTLRPQAPTPVSRPTLDAAELLARYRQLPACRMRITAETTFRGETQKAKATLLFRRPDHLRIDWEAPGEVIQLVHTLAERYVFYPQWRSTETLARARPNGQAWDGFFNPARSLAALIEPTPADSAALEKYWLPALKPTGSETTEGAVWLRFRGRGAWGSRLELWVSPEDHLIRRVQVRSPRQPDVVASEIRIEVDRLDKPPPDAAFQIDRPKQAPPANEARRPQGGPGQEGAGGLRALRQRAAASHGDPRAAHAVIAALQQTGRQAEALQFALEQVRTFPSPSSYQLLTGVYWALGAHPAAVNAFLQAIRRYGPRARFADSALQVGSLQLSAGRAAETAAAMERLTAGKPMSFEQRLLLAHLCRGAGQYDSAARQLLVILDCGPAGRAPGRDQVDAIRNLYMLVEVGPEVDPATRRQLARALRDAVPRIGELEPTVLLPLYLALDDPEAAERLVEQVRPGVLDGYDGAARVADGYARLGAREQAGRLFRTALLSALDSAAGNNPALTGLFQHIENARVFLAPVYRRLADDERGAEPLSSAQWFFAAGDYAPAAQACRDYLTGPAGAPETSPPIDRLDAAMLGARSAREAKEPALVDRFLLDAVPALLRLRGDLPADYWGTPGQYVRALLDAAGDTPARRPFIEQIAATQPEALLEALSDEGAARRGPVNPDDLNALLDRVGAAAAGGVIDAEAFARQLQSLGRAREAAEVYVRFARRFPARIDPELAIQLAQALESQTQRPDRSAGSAPPGGEDPLVRELVRAVATLLRLRAGWEPAEATLARWYLTHGEAATGIDLLAGIARRRGSAAAYAALADAELIQGRRPEDTRRGLDHLRMAIHLDPENPDLHTRYGGALRAAGKGSDALAWWRGLKEKAATAGPVMAVAGGLRRLGHRAEAIAFIEARYPTIRAAERDPARSGALRSELVAYYRQQRQPAKILSLFPEVRLFELEVDPEAVRHLNLSLPPEVLQQLLARFDRGGLSQAGFITRSAALLAGGPDSKDEAYQDLIQRARRLGKLAAARDVLRELAAEPPPAGNPLARAWLAAVEEELGNADAATTHYRRLLHPDGAPYPHPGPGVVRAARGLATLLAKQNRPAEAGRYRAWADAFSLLESAGHADPVHSLAILQRAHALFPESPCIQAAICRQQPEGPASERAVLTALELMVPVCGDVRRCADCWPLLTRQAGPAGRDALPVQKLLAATRHVGGAYFLIAAAKTAAGDPYAPEHRALWRGVVERDPKIIAAWEALRAIARRQRDADRLIEAARQVATLRASSASDWMQLATAYRSARLRPDRFAGARAAVRKARELDPGEPSLRWEAIRELDWPPADDTFDQVSFGSFVGSYYGPSHSFNPW